MFRKTKCWSFQFYKCSWQIKENYPFRKIIKYEKTIHTSVDEQLIVCGNLISDPNSAVTVHTPLIVSILCFDYSGMTL